ncbi:hypothetical protein ABZP36_028622 [Zizania latifolia]
MAGRGSRRGAGAEEVRIGSSNVFAALETLKRKKKPAAGKKQASAGVAEKERKPEVLWAPTPLTTKSWADVDDDDDDDYFATTAPPPPVWDTQQDSAAAAHDDDDTEHAALEQVFLAVPLASLSTPVCISFLHMYALPEQSNANLTP